MPIHHLSLCAGIGGIDLGLRRVVGNIRTVAMVEREAFCCANLVKAMEEGELDPCPIYADLLRFPWQKYRGVVDIVSGGFPCQPFSEAGLRKSTEDDRHLWPHIKAGLAVLRPGVCFFENVEGIATAKSPGYHSVLHNVLCDLEEMGYRATAGCFSAEEVGAPHRRKRWFILGLADCDSGGLEVVGSSHNHHGGDASGDNLDRCDQSQLANAKSIDGRSGCGESEDREESSTRSELANADSDPCDQGEPRRASRELPEEGQGLRRRQSQRQAREESWGSRELDFGDSGGFPALGDSDLQGLEGPGAEHRLRSCGQEAEAGGSGELADTNGGRGGQGLEQPQLWAEGTEQSPGDSGRTRPGSESQASRWPARPGEAQHVWEEPRVVKPSMGGTTNELPGRVDRLRSLGNAVVPEVAAKAFVHLLKEVMDERVEAG